MVVSSSVVGQVSIATEPVRCDEFGAAARPISPVNWYAPTARCSPVEPLLCTRRGRRVGLPLRRRSANHPVERSGIEAMGMLRARRRADHGRYVRPSNRRAQSLGAGPDAAQPDVRPARRESHGPPPDAHLLVAARRPLRPDRHRTLASAPSRPSRARARGMIGVVLGYPSESLQHGPTAVLGKPTSRREHWANVGDHSESVTTTPRSAYGWCLRLTNPPSLARTRVTLVMKPYLATTLS